MSSPEGVCPVHTKKEIVGHEDNPTLAAQLEKTSQDIMDQPNNAKDSLDRLEAKLRKHYELMLVHDPSKAEYSIARKLRATVKGPLVVNIYSNLVASLSRYSEDELIEELNLSRMYPYDFSDTFINAKYDGSSAEWMHFMYGMACNALTAATSGTPEARFMFEQLEEQTEYLWPKLADTAEAAAYDVPFNWRDRTLMLDLIQGVAENLTVSLDVIRAAHMAIAVALQEATPNQDGIAKIMYNNIDNLGLAASMNRETINKVLPSANGHHWPLHVGVGKTKDLKRLAGVFRYEDGQLTPTHPSLKNGEWRWPGNCAGRWSQQLTDGDLLNDVVGFFDNIGHAEIYPIDTQEVKALNLLLAAGVEVGLHCLFTGKETQEFVAYCP